MAINRTLPLDERINKLRADLDAYIDARIAEIRKTCPGVPDGVIRSSLTRGMGCQCSAFLEIMAKDERENAA